MIKKILALLTPATATAPTADEVRAQVRAKLAERNAVCLSQTVVKA